MKTELNRSGNKRGLNPKSRKNLEKGREGNNHAKKDYSITRMLKEMANEAADERWLEVEDKGKGLSWRQAAAKRLWIETVRGNISAAGEVLNRVDGKPMQPAGIEGTIVLRVEYDDKDRIQNPPS